MQVSILKRVFMFNGNPLSDPDTSKSGAAVKDFYAAMYPELLNAEVQGPVEADGKLVYTFHRVTGTKGATGVQPKGTLVSFMQRLEIAAGEAPKVTGLPRHQVASLRQVLTPQFGGQSLQLPGQSCPLLL